MGRDGGGAAFGGGIDIVGAVARRLRFGDGY
jgi:hypothetical protein